MTHERPHGGLPPITPLESTNAELIRVSPHPDWLIGAGGHVWVTGVDDGVAVFEPRTGRRVASIAIDGDLCGAPDAGFGAVWFPTCGPAAIHRVSIETFELTASVPLELLPSGEFTIGAGAGGVWAILQERRGSGRLAHIDTGSDRIADVFEVPSRALSVRAGPDALWVAYPDDDMVRRIDPSDGQVRAEFETGSGPRFLVVGPEGVWVLNQASGSVTYIDPASDTVVAEIGIDVGPMRGGDIALGRGSVWVRGSRELVTQIDPSKGQVVARFGEPSAGSASVAVVEGQLWISAGAEGLLYRIPLT